MEKNLDFTPNPKLKLMEQSSGSITVILPPADAETTYFQFIHAAIYTVELPLTAGQPGRR